MRADYDPESRALYIHVNVPTEGRRRYTLEVHDGIEEINADFEETPGSGPHLLLGLEVLLPEPLRIITAGNTGNTVTLPVVTATAEASDA